MIRQIVGLWGDAVKVYDPEEAVLRAAAEWLHENPEGTAADYCFLVGRAIGLPRKMDGPHLLRTCTSVWAGQRGLDVETTPLLGILAAKVAEAPYRDHIGLWDGLWVPLAFEVGALELLVDRQRSSRTTRQRRDLERLLRVGEDASDEDLQEALETLLQQQRLEKRALAVGLSTEATEDDVREREEELCLPELRAVGGRFPEDALDEYLRIRNRLKELRGYSLPMKSTGGLPTKCTRCGTTIRDHTTPCRKDGGVCDDVGPEYYRRPVRVAA